MYSLTTYTSPLLEFYQSFGSRLKPDLTVDTFSQWRGLMSHNHRHLQRVSGSADEAPLTPVMSLIFLLKNINRFLADPGGVFFQSCIFINLSHVGQKGMLEKTWCVFNELNKFYGLSEIFFQLKFFTHGEADVWGKRINSGLIACNFSRARDCNFSRLIWTRKADPFSSSEIMT